MRNHYICILIPRNMASFTNCLLCFAIEIGYVIVMQRNLFQQLNVIMTSENYYKNIIVWSVLQLLQNYYWLKISWLSFSTALWFLKCWKDLQERCYCSYYVVTALVLYSWPTPCRLDWPWLYWLFYHGCSLWSDLDWSLLWVKYMHACQ